MDAGKIAKMAMDYAGGLPAGDTNKDGLTQLATKWINDHQKSPFTMAALNDAKALQVDLYHKRQHCIVIIVVNL